jgi:hypothetical protein
MHPTPNGVSGQEVCELLCGAPGDPRNGPLVARLGSAWLRESIPRAHGLTRALAQARRAPRGQPTAIAPVAVHVTRKPSDVVCRGECQSQTSTFRISSAAREFSCASESLD